MSDRRRLRARWIFPTDAPPIENGFVEIERGLVTAVAAGSPPDGIDLGNAALIPGLVNAHTHLEFSHLSRPIAAEGTFARWIGDVIAERGGRTATAEECRGQGLQESRQAGIAAIGEIATSLWPSAQIPAGGPRLCLYREVLGLAPEAAAARIADLETHLGQAATDPPGVRRGISPHAPYSVHPDLFDRTIALARRHRSPVAMHLAETTEELQLLAEGTGPLVDLFTRMGIWRPEAIPRGTRPLDYLRRLAEVDRGLVVHGNHLDEEEIAFVARQPQLTVVYCPQTHAHFRHSRHPLPRLLAAGAQVALGTDSRASSASLSLWDDLLIARRAFPELPPPILLDLATRRGAEALGDRDLGRLEAGRPAALTLVSLLDDRRGSDPWQALLADGTRARAVPIG